MTPHHIMTDKEYPIPKEQIKSIVITEPERVTAISEDSWIYTSTFNNEPSGFRLGIDSNTLCLREIDKARQRKLTEPDRGKNYLVKFEVNPTKFPYSPQE